MTAALLAHTTGRHHRPPLCRRLLASLHARRQRRQAEAARDDAYASVLHEINVDRHAPAPRPVRVTAAGPPPAAITGEDDGKPWELETGQFPAIIDAMGRGWME